MSKKDNNDKGIEDRIKFAMKAADKFYVEGNKHAETLTNNLLDSTEDDIINNVNEDKNIKRLYDIRKRINKLIYLIEKTRLSK